MLDNAWLIPILPFAASVVLLFFGKRLGSVVGPLVGILATGASFVLAAGSLFALRAGAGPLHVQFRWAQVGDFIVNIGMQLGNLEAFIVTMVTFASFFIQMYAIGYMWGDEKYNRFFTVVTLFTAGMLATVMADNLLLLLVGWEVMGFASFSLIGHWFENLDNARAAMKAFITTRVGDLGLLAGMFVIFVNTGTLEFEGIFRAVNSAEAGASWITLAALFLFWAAIGKSAQLPLHIWLPDAMAGPTPVSALIHAATMVAAGVFLVARNYPLFLASGTAMNVVAWVGAISALFAAIVAVLQEDIKKVLAYSTMSQLGYMMMALGVGGYAAGLFHLTSHGFFKALLFLGAGSVIVALHHEQNLHRMGGLFKKLPVTGVTFLIGTLALAGIWPFSGFYSKDAVLIAAYESNSTLFWIGLVAAALTAFYMTRLVFLAFFGAPRDRKAYEKTTESPAVMLVPLIMLAIPSLLIGMAYPSILGTSVEAFLSATGEAAGHGAGTEVVPALATGAAVLGIVVGVILYGGAAGLSLRRGLIGSGGALYAIVKRAFYIDDLYRKVFVGGSRALAGFASFFDKYVIDGLVNGIAGIMVVLGGITRRLNTGYAQSYLMVLFAGVILVILVFQTVGG